MRLEDKTAMVTGGASGIGRATCLLLAREGASVLLLDRDADGGHEVAREITSLGGKARFVESDVSKAADVERAFSELDGAFGSLHVLAHCAGINPRGTAETTSLELWDSVLDTNLKSLFLLSRGAVPRMARAGGGSIVTIASINGLVAWKNELAYDASKGGVVMMTRSLAVDHAEQGIRANCICPGVIDTPMLRRTARSQPDENAFMANVGKLQPAGRVGQPEDIAYAILFLASDESSFVTGATLPVDGGYTAV